MKNKHLYTASELFTTTMAQLEEEKKIPENLLDYAIPTRDKYELRDYAFDVLGCVNYGNSEGIYVDIFFRGDIGENDSHSSGITQGKIGTIKTLSTSDDAFRQMAVLMADFQIAATKFINTHLDDFTWSGFDIDYYFREGEDLPAYGVTMKGSMDDAVSEARKTLARFPRYKKAVVTNNNNGIEKVVLG